MLRRRHTDLSIRQERRHTAVDRRLSNNFYTHPPTGVRFPSFQEQTLQYLTRYLFAVLGLCFFNLANDADPKWMEVSQINLLFGIYLVVNTIDFIHSWIRPYAPLRYRFALWIDLALVTICVANDPYSIPPSLIAYIVVVLGNGMRYGMVLFGEALLGSLLSGAIAMSIRYMQYEEVFTPGTIFLSLFGAIVIIYAYILMSRVEGARRRTELVSRTDALTSLFNRRGLNEVATTWLSAARNRDACPVIMFADLDNFKSVNDTKGHAEGDRTLVNVASLLKDNLRSTDIIARYGGDEFVLLLASAGLSEATMISNRVQREIDTWFHSNNLPCGISIGFAEVMPEDNDLEEMLHSVDQLLYRSKAERKRNGIRA